MAAVYKFATSYEQLNPKQREAVDHIEGPLLVVAGPGTGKTQLLSMRVANIMHKTDTEPASILCLTFTNKAAANMRERLYELGGAETRRVMVKTFHSFAAEIMSRYPDYFWQGARLSVAPDAVQLEIIESVLSALPHDHAMAMQFAGQYTQVGEIKQALKLIKEAGLTPEKLQALIAYNVAYIDSIEEALSQATEPRLSIKRLDELQAAVQALPVYETKAELTPLTSLYDVITSSLEYATLQDRDSGKTTYTSRWKRRWIQTVDGHSGMHDERRRNQWWLDMVEIYSRYRELLHTRGYYDYADMLVEVISQLEQNAQLRAQIQEQFLYVLIDEFQDTNSAQLRLAHLVADHFTTEGAPNIMAVGDDDQSIFKFNGAELNNMLSFTASYPSCKTIVLTDNYRSNKAVLTMAERVITQANDRLVKRVPHLSKQLVSRTQTTTTGTQILQVFDTAETELSAVADQLYKLTAKQRLNTAVLARSHGSLRRLAYLCLRRGVPVHYEQQANILDHPAIELCIQLCELIEAISQGNEQLVNARMQQVIRHPMWALKPQWLWQLAVDTYPNKSWFETMTASRHAPVTQLADWLQWLSQQAAHAPLALMLEYILGLRPGEKYVSPLRTYFTAQHDSRYLEALSAIRLLRNLVAEFSATTDRSVEDFLRFVHVMRENQQVISDESPFVSGQQAVQLLTVHKAKGLEFDRVFVLDCINSEWRPRPARRRPPANLPLQPNGDDEDDYVRLLYVAITRARHSVYLCSYELDANNQETMTSPLALAAVQGQKLRQSTVATQHEAILEEHLAWPQLITREQQHMLKARLDSFSLNVTGLLNFLDVGRGGPQYFLERTLLRLPEAKTASLSLGTAIHVALEAGQRQRLKGQFKLSIVLKAFGDALQHEHLPQAEYDRYLARGNALLTKLFQDFGYQLPKNALPEEPFYEVGVGQALTGGALDRIDLLSPTELVVVDYKTGAGLTNLTTQNNSQALKAWKHRMQLIFYAMLVQHTPRFRTYTHISGQMVYVEAKQAKHLVQTYTPSREEITKMEQLVEIVWRKVKALDLPKVSNYSADLKGIETFVDGLLAGKV